MALTEKNSFGGKKRKKKAVSEWSKYIFLLRSKIIIIMTHRKIKHEVFSFQVNLEVNN